MNSDSIRSPLRSVGLLAFLAAAILGLTVDLATKYLAFDHPTHKLLDGLVRDQAQRQWFPIGADEREVRLVPGFLHLRATVNEGAVFGVGQGKQVVFVGISVLAFFFLLFLFSRTHSRFDQILLGCLLAGVLGNMYDRVQYSYVRDMIYIFHDWGIFPWIFNVADMLLCGGVGTLLVRNVIADFRKPAAPEARAADNQAADGSVGD